MSSADQSREAPDKIVGARVQSGETGALGYLDRQLLEANPDCVMVTTPDGRLHFVNSAGLRLFEIEDFEGIAGRELSELWPDGLRHEIEAALLAARGGRSMRSTTFYPTFKGMPRWLDLATSPIKDDTGRVAYIALNACDITANTSLTETLRRSEQRFEALANNVPQLAWMADPKGDIFWYNQRWYDYTGASMESMVGQGWRTVHHPDHLDRVVDKFMRCIEAGTVWEDLFPLRAPDGTYRWFLSRANPVRDADGRISLWCGTNTDVTEQRMQSQRLRQLARIIELAHEAILVREIGGSIVLWNRGCQELYGFSASAAIGASSFELLKPQNIPPSEAFDALVLADGTWSGEILYIANDGTEAWVDSRQELIKVGDRNLVLETSRDITDRRQADEIRNLLVGELNHRVKNTLAIVQSIAAQTARTSPTPTKFVMSFNSRLQSLASAHNVLTDAFWSGAPVRELVRSQLSVAGADESRFVLDGEPLFLPPQTALQMTMILHELAANAVAHGALSVPNGRVAVSWALANGEPRMVDLVWREHGGPPVAPPAARGFGLTLIERSSALPNLKASVEFPTGGLVARIAAELHADERKSTFFNPGQRLTRARQPEPLNLRSEAKRIMIMDRSFNAALFLEDMLESAGHVTVGPMSTALSAIAELNRRSVDLVTIDIDEISASDVDVMTGELRNRMIPCVAVGSPQVVSASPASGFSAMIAKPLNEFAFLAAVRESLAHYGN